MDGRPQGRRQACDLCFTKKIKCDRLEPVCSNCALYKANCETTIPRRTPESSRSKHGVVNKNAASGKRRAEGIQKRIQKIIEDTEEAHARASRESVLQNEPPLSSSSNSTSSWNDAPAWRFDPVDPSLYYGPPDTGRHLFLPPLHDIMPAIDHYFHVVNRAAPLFSQISFMRLVTAWYRTTNPKRDNATWAAILVVVALGLRSMNPEDPKSPDSSSRTDEESFCIRNAQAMIPDLISREDDLLGVQVVTALAKLFRHSGDARPASVLLGMAMRLAHRMQLHSTTSNAFLTPQEAQERTRVFWVLYSIDKDFALRTRTPPIQSDEDVGVEPPAEAPSDGVGIIWSRDSSSRFNYFRMSVDLAIIQSRIYQQIFSTRALKIDKSERYRRIYHLQRVLDDWYSRIPSPFRIERILDTVDESMIPEMTCLYHTYQGCIITLHGIYSQDASWMKRVNSLSRAAIEDFAAAVQGSRVAVCAHVQQPPEAAGWAHCVEFGRNATKLFQLTQPTVALIWHCSCAHFSTLIIILANVLISPELNSAASDLELVSHSIDIFGHLLDIFETPAYASLRQVIMDLQSSAARAMQVDDSLNRSGKLPSGFSHTYLMEDLNLAEEDLVFETGNITEVAGEFTPFVPEQEASVFGAHNMF